jgi:hypothetical protein
MGSATPGSATPSAQSDAAGAALHAAGSEERTQYRLMRVAKTRKILRLRAFA